ncbi:MAG: hypothetical protein R2856_22670, partial [Caldilineaceae bacterium]
ADRRSWGVWWMGGGLLVGAVFFVAHSAILGQDLSLNLDGLDFWWRTGWFPITLSPMAWYVAVLWVSGYWSIAPNSLRQRHRFWLWGMLIGLVGLLVLLVAGNPIPAYDRLIQVDLTGVLMVRDTPLLFVLAPLWMAACIVLSIDVLRRPAAVDNANTLAARQRALPWLLSTAAILLVVTLVVAWFIGALVTDIVAGALRAIPLQTVAVYDLVLSLLIAVASLLLGQAIVAYEVFTGRVLPRRSFVRHWRSAVILAAGYAVVVAWTITIALRPIYSLLLATLLLTVFYALFSWRSFREREQFAARLRPFVQRQGTAGPLLTASSAQGLLAALCRDLLNTAHAQLIPLGSMTSLVDAPLIYPEIARGLGGSSGSERIFSESIRPNPPNPLNPRAIPPDLSAGMTPLDRAIYAPFAWAISLWDERERIGVLLVGDKRDGGLYSQEELETAQAAGERIVHLLAGEQMVQRLIDVQRQRTAEQRVIDLSTRRTLHDEILPSIHLTILQLSGADRQQPVIRDTLDSLTDVHRQIAALLSQSRPSPPRTGDPCNLVTSLRSLVENEFSANFERVDWMDLLTENAADPSADAPAHVDALVGEVILGAAREAIRNAAAHGRGDRADLPLCLRVGLRRERQRSGELILTIADNGIGVNAAPSSTTGGSGSGLSLHRTLLAILGGDLVVETSAAGGTVVTISL